MSTRSWLHIVSVGLLVIAAACTGPKPRSRPPAAADRYDVIVVGAGLAGLTAGKQLRAAGRSFVILEATDRIGGRGHTDTTTFSVPLDLGGAWIHDLKTNPLTPIILGSGYTTNLTDGEAANHLFFDHHFANAGEQARFERIVEAFEESLAVNLEHDRAAHEHLPVAEPEGDPAAPGEASFEKLRDLVALNFGPLESAVELANSSTVDASQFLAGEDVLLDRGFGTFIEEYGEDIRPMVQLGSPVTRIVRDDAGVTVETAKGQRLSARMALVTVSTGVLAAGKIKFEPALPVYKEAAIRGLPMGLLNKVLLEFSNSGVFPRKGDKPVANAWLLYGGDLDRNDDDMAIVFGPAGSSVAIGFFGGDRAWELEKLPDHGREKMIAITLAALSDMCGCDAGRALVASRTTAWGSNEWTLGAYSAALPGQAAMRQKLAQPVDHQIFFAGEACDYSTYNGSFAGAYNSALKSSHQMIICLRKQDRQQPCH